MKKLTILAALLTMVLVAPLRAEFIMDDFSGTSLNPSNQYTVIGTSTVVTRTETGSGSFGRVGAVGLPGPIELNLLTPAVFTLNYSLSQSLNDTSQEQTAATGAWGKITGFLLAVDQVALSPAPFNSIFTITMNAGSFSQTLTQADIGNDGLAGFGSNGNGAGITSGTIFDIGQPRTLNSFLT